MAIMNFGILLLIISITNSIMFAEALKCYQCGTYTDGAGSITPCLNYTDQTAPFYLKDCPRSSNAFCIKYESELSIVRDCVAKCSEKEVWNTRTYCCNTDGCNDAFAVTMSKTTTLIALAASSFISTILLRHQ